MNIIIIGCGRFGSTLAKELSNTNHNVSVVDRDNERLGMLGNGFNGLKVRGIEYDDEVLKEAGIETADAILPVTPDENLNITVAMIAKEIYQVPRIIARIVNSNRQYIYDNLGIETLNPNNLGVELLKSKLNLDKVDIISIVDSKHVVASILVEHEHKKTIQDIENAYGCIISGILDRQGFSFPQKDLFVKADQRLICTIDQTELNRILIEL